MILPIFVSKLRCRYFSGIAQSLEIDTSVNQTLKAFLRNFYQSFAHSQSMMDIFQQQLNQKASSSQLHFSLSQKLSINEFVAYFQKVQNLIEKVQSHTSSAHNNLTKIIDQKIYKHVLDIQHANKRFQQQLATNDKNTNRLAPKINEATKKRYKALVGALQNGLKGKQNQQPQKKKNPKEEQNKIIHEMRVIQEYCKQNHKNINTLMQKVKTQRKIITSKTNESQWLWNSRSSMTKLFAKDSNTNFTSHYNNTVKIEKEGLYQLICGAFPVSTGQLSIFLNQNQLAEHQFEEDENNVNISRTLMIYLFIEVNSVLSFHCQSNKNSRGFIHLISF